MTDPSPVLIERRDAAAILTLNRPEQRNPLSVEMMLAVTESLRTASLDPGVRAIVIRGAGTLFSAGHNLREMVNRELDDQREIFDVCTRMMQAVQAVPQPVIAQVHGVAAAAGCQLVATCDLAIAGLLRAHLLHVVLALSLVRRPASSSLT